MDLSSEDDSDTELETEESDESETKGPNLCVCTLLWVFYKAKYNILYIL